MKSSVKSLLLGLLLLAVVAPSAQAQAQTKIGVVNLRVLFEKYYKTKQADAKIKERAAELDKERDDMIKQFRDEEAAFKKAEEFAQDLTVSAEERARRKTEAERMLLALQERQKTIAAWERSATATIQEQQTRMRTRVIEEIQAEVTAIARTEGFFIVLDKDADSANQTKVIVYHNGDNDITDRVLANLNAGAPAGLLEDKKTP